MLEMDKIIFLKYQTLEEQVNAQGYTLGDKAERLEIMREGINYMWADGIITENEMKKYRKAVINSLMMQVRRKG